MTRGTGDPPRILEGAFSKDVLGKDAADEFRTDESWFMTEWNVVA